MWKLKQYGLAILSSGVFLVSAAYADADDAPGDNGGHASEAHLAPASSARPSPDDAMRNLLLQNAIQNGDLTEDEAKKLAPRLFHRIPVPPAGNRPADKPGNRFWRDQRRQTMQPPPSDP
jgi:hypothetical protein